MKVGTKLVNRFEYWRAQYSAKAGRIVEREEWAALLGLDAGLYSNYKNHHKEPLIQTYYRVWENLKKLFPDRAINLQDLMEVIDDASK